MATARQGNPLWSLAAELNLPDHVELRERMEDVGPSELYLGRDRLRGKMVVVKAVRGAEARTRLSAAARAMGRVSHPGAQRLVAAGSSESATWVVTDLAERGSLQDLIDHAESHPSGLHASEVISWLAVIADALASAHRSGVLHGDVSPSNILLSTGGSGRIGGLYGTPIAAVIADFGSAEVAGTGGTRGGFTPRYASPQRRSGSPPEASDDVYGLCATALECLAHSDGTIPKPLRSLLERGTSENPRRRPTMDTVVRRFVSAG